MSQNMAVTSDEVFCTKTMEETNAIYKSNMDEFTLAKSIEELGENPADRMVALRAFREWIDGQTSWLHTPTDPNFLMSFLRMRKFSQLSARKALVDYWSSRMERPMWFSKVDTTDPAVMAVIQSGALLVLPGRDKDGRTVLLGRPGAIDNSGEVYSADDVFKGAFTVADYLLRDENTQVNGFVSITDFSHFSIMHNNFKGSGNIRKNAAIWSKVYPIRVKAIHHYNMGQFGEFAFSLSKPFLPEKVHRRIYNHSTLVSLYEHIDKGMLPLEYLPDDYEGPNAGSVQSLTEDLLAELTKPETRDYIGMLSDERYGITKANQPPQTHYMTSYRKLSDD